MYRILSFDGGGIRGILSARIVERLGEARPGFAAKTDMFAGTSTGSILALALAKGLSAHDIVELYEDTGPHIFSHRDFWDRFALDELRRADYAAEPLKRALKGSYGDTLVGDLGADILVPALNISRWRPKFFNKDDDSWTLWEVGLASAAAPTYLPGFTGPDGCCYADGGLFANNPAPFAITETQIKGLRLDSVVMLSLGTGAFRPAIQAADGMDWGIYQWALDPGLLMPAVFDAPVMAATTSAERILGDRFRRIQPQLQKPVDLDETGKIDELLAEADDLDLRPTLDWVDEHWL